MIVIETQYEYVTDKTRELKVRKQRKPPLIEDLVLVFKIYCL